MIDDADLTHLRRGVEPFYDLRHEFHIDHVFPRSRFTQRRLAQEGVSSVELRTELAERADRLANLQLLDGAQNTEKNSALPGNGWKAA